MQLKFLREMDTLATLTQIKNAKSFSDIRKIFENNVMVDFQAVRIGSLYNITLGTHGVNIFIQLYLGYAPRIDAVVREFNGVNYDLQKQTSAYVNRRGYEKLHNYLQNLTDERHLSFPTAGR